MKKVDALVAEGGIEAWTKAKPEELIGEDAKNYVKSTDILDVWFDSGTTPLYGHARFAQGHPRMARRPLS